MSETDELDDFRTAVAMLHSFALESPVLNQRGIPRHLERIINIAAQLSAEETQGHQAKGTARKQRLGGIEHGQA